MRTVALFFSSRCTLENRPQIPAERRLQTIQEYLDHFATLAQQHSSTAAARQRMSQRAAVGLPLKGSPISAAVLVQGCWLHLHMLVLMSFLDTYVSLQQSAVSLETWGLVYGRCMTHDPHTAFLWYLQKLQQYNIYEYQYLQQRYQDTPEIRRVPLLP